MVLTTRLSLRNLSLSDVTETRIRRKIDTLARRLAHYPDPIADLTLTEYPAPRRFGAELRVQLGPLAPHLISHQSGETVDRVVGLAVRDVERQLEKRQAKQRGEPSYGTPSRRRSGARKTAAGPE